jgi:hypothetical protein
MASVVRSADPECALAMNLDVVADNSRPAL